MKNLKVGNEIFFVMTTKFNWINKSKSHFPEFKVAEKKKEEKKGKFKVIKHILANIKRKILCEKFLNYCLLKD